jgi:hypothetical protein
VPLACFNIGVEAARNFVRGAELQFGGRVVPPSPLWVSICSEVI